MTTEKNLKDLFAATAYDKDGDKLGAVKEIFVDDETGQPAFAEVGHGLFGMSSSLVPMRGHRFSGEDLQLAFSKDRIKDAPDVGTDEHLTREDQQRVWDHYQLSDTEDTERYRAEERAARDVDHRREAAAGAGAGAGVAGNRPGHVADDRERVADRDRADVADRTRTEGDSMVRSEERLNVDKENVETGQVRLRKHVVKDTETVEVPVTREEVRVEREPISREEAANVDSKLGDDEASVTLHEERVNVSKESVPVEKVNLGKETVRDTETHTEELRKEQIEADGLRDDARTDDRRTPPAR